MATFDLNKARNYRKKIKGRLIESSGFAILTGFLWGIAVLAVLVCAYDAYAGGDILFRLGLFVLALSSSAIFTIRFLRAYFVSKQYLSSDNIAEALSQESLEIVDDAIRFARENKFAVVEPIILLSSLEQNKDGKYLLLRCGLGIEKDVSEIIAQAVAEVPKQTGQKPVQISPDVALVFDAARQNAIASSRDSVSAGDILVGLVKMSDVFKKLMFEIKIEEGDIKEIVEWHEELLEKIAQFHRSFWTKDYIEGGIGRDWSFGFTPTLNQFGRNLNLQVEGAGAVRVYGRNREIEETERILAKTSQNNVLLIGDHGIGRKTIVKGFATKIVQGKVLVSLRYQQIFQVDTGALLSGSASSGEVAERVKKVFNEAVRSGNIILFFDNFHALVSRTDGIGQVNTSEIILPYLEAGVKVIGATTLADYHKNIEANPGVAAAFNRIEVKEPNQIETVEILQEMIPMVEGRDGVFWPYQAVKETVRVADRYIHNEPFPQKAIEIVDEVSVEVAKRGEKIVHAKIIDELISKKLEVPVAQAEGEEAKKLLNLEAFLHKRIIGQDEAVKAVSDAMRRARSGIQSKERPIGNFLFLGPTGVGKTEASKALAEAYFGSEKSMTRVDMSEFQEQSSIYRLIGSPPAAGAEGEKGQLTTAVADNPFCLILLDEIEKAHKDIITLFLQVFDDGRLTDGTGKTIDFTNAIIIATSNAGSELIRQNLQKNIHGQEMKKSLLDYLQKQGIFRPEFLNRFDAVVDFHPLSEVQIRQVAELMLKSLAARMAEKEITVQFTPKAVDKLARAGFDPVYGARPMRRAIQDKVENMLAQKMLSGLVTRGAKVVVDEKDIV